jgi:hypothetical protein
MTSACSNAGTGVDDSAETVALPESISIGEVSVDKRGTMK